MGKEADTTAPVADGSTELAGDPGSEDSGAQDRYRRALGNLRVEQKASERFLRRQLEMGKEVRAAKEAAQQWQARYQQLEHSAAVRIVSRFRQVVERIAPQGTARRRVYSHAVTAARGVLRRAPHAPAGGPASAELPVIPMALQPEVSIIIPVHNAWSVTAGCLQSIAADFAAVGYEVIVVDDASDDETPDALAKAVGVRVVRLDENQGFIGAVNAGVAVARGRYLVLLNNDTLCRAGWLDALVRTIESDESIGVVGAKLVYPDGRLQEAGGIIWQDGSAYNYGRNEDADHPAYNFVRDVDYCSGACLLVRRELLMTLGGLDTRFTPAYYEDVDLCFAARQHGYRVVYQPAAVVCHLEGVSHGTDATSGIKHYQVVNQQTLREKWSDALIRQGEPEPVPPRLSSWRRPAGRALVIDHRIPMPDQDAGSGRIFELMLLLQELGLGVTFYPLNRVLIPRYQDALTSRGIEVLAETEDLDTYLDQMGSALKVAVLSRPTVAWAIYPMMRTRSPATPLVYDTVDLHYLRERGHASFEGGMAAEQRADFHFDIELTLARLCEQTWTVTHEEKDALLAELPDLRIEVVPTIHQDEPRGLTYEQRRGIVFVGSYSHAPNSDAALWLANDILPIVRRQLPDVQLHLVGSSVTSEIEALARDDVVVDGWVPSLDEVYRRMRVVVAPLRFGAGMKGKVGEALAHGVPVVTTAIGAQGHGLRHGEDALIADDAEGLAQAIVDAYRNRDLWARLATNGPAAVARTSSPASVRRVLAHALADLGVPVTD